ncbi:pentapeptide repeat-containing protein [Erwinia sp. 9145]|uniref:pentapeptide repeat-containing protein n=1 Tax=Erwinia sp. 9145 TaxID=1500895 RepID=UPI000551ED99|nr:pentapeptide repeat-containing protein [Erwinia sp. 9145]
MRNLESNISVENELFFDIVRYEKQSISQATIKRSNVGSPIFINCKLDDVIFDECDLSNTRFFSDCTIEMCKFIHSDLRAIGIGKDEAVFIKCEFASCDMRGMTMENAKFIDCVFIKCKINGRTLKPSNIINCTFTGKLVDITFEGKGKEKLLASFESCILEGAVFIGCDLTHCIPPKLKNHLYIDQLSKRVKIALEMLSKDESLSGDDKKLLIRKINKLSNTEQYIFNIKQMEKTYNDIFVENFFKFLGVDDI